MTKRSKWFALSALVCAGGALLQNGCLQSFWQGFWTTGWPTDNRWLNLGLDVVNEVVFG